MRNLTKIAAWVLGLAMLLGLGAAAAESTMPVIPDFRDTLNVRPIGTEEDAVAYAKEIWALDYLGMDFEIEYYDAHRFDQDTWVVYAKTGPDDGDYCYGAVMFDTDGNVTRVENASSGVFEILIEAENYDVTEHEPVEVPEDDDAWAEWRDTLDRKLEFSFLETASPAIYDEYIALYPKTVVNNDTLTHYNGTFADHEDDTLRFNLNYSESYRNDTWRIQYAVQISPVIRIVYFDVYTDAEEGGNG